jgi:iron complex outermembrane receptor protein
MIVRLLFLFVSMVALVAPAQAQGGAPAQQTPQGGTQDENQPVRVEEQVVVTASKTEQQLVNAPAAVSIVSTETIQNSPATNVGDLLRAVPGLNVSQISARDVNITSRGATSSLATSQLALVDGRSVYLDFFGMVLWDLVPTNPSDIRQIEVIRGPASAVWGANAMTGVVNVITRTPRELAARGGTSLTIGTGVCAGPSSCPRGISLRIRCRDRSARFPTSSERRTRITRTRVPLSRSSTRAWTTTSWEAAASSSAAASPGPRG